MLSSLSQADPVHSKLQRFGNLDMDAPGPIPLKDRLGFVLRDRLSGKLGAVVGGWGLIPGRLPVTEVPAFQAKFSTHVANAETVATKTLWAEAFKLRRCAIPVAGFHLLDDRSRQQQLHAVCDIDEPVAWLAGLWEHHRSIGYTVAVIASEANSRASYAANRMPVILDRRQAQNWIDLGHQALLCPWPSQLTAMCPAERWQSWDALRAYQKDQDAIHQANVARTAQLSPGDYRAPSHREIQGGQHAFATRDEQAR